MYSIESFIAETAKALQDTQNVQLRFGQLYMNLLYERRVDLYDQITMTKVDPFYDDQRITEFWTYLRSNW